MEAEIQEDFSSEKPEGFYCRVREHGDLVQKRTLPVEPVERVGYQTASVYQVELVFIQDPKPLVGGDEVAWCDGIQWQEPGFGFVVGYRHLAITGSCLLYTSPSPRD